LFFLPYFIKFFTRQESLVFLDLHIIGFSFMSEKFYILKFYDTACLMPTSNRKKYSQTNKNRALFLDLNF